MYTQAKSKKAVSVIVGYVLLITFAVIIGVIVFRWMKTYVPQEDINCPDGVSLFIESYQYDLDTHSLILNLKNNGKFNIGGYFIYATDSPEKELATIDISKYNVDVNSRLKPYGIKFGGLTPRNALSPNRNETEVYNLTELNKEIYSVEILPIRWQVEKNRIVLVSCKDAKIKEIISYKIPCVPESVEDTCGTAVCGTKLNNCNEPVDCPPDCSGENVCNTLTGRCVLPEQCTDTCLSSGWVCGIVCGVPCGSCDLDNALSVCDTGTCIISSCDVGWCNSNGIASDGCEAPLGTTSNCASCGNTCATGFNCVDGSCTLITIGNGICDTGETCAQEPIACQGYQATCSSGYICISGLCQQTTGGLDCTNFCIGLLNVPPYVSSACVANNGQCTSAGGYLGGTGGNTICTAKNPSYSKCCCFT